MIETNQVLLQMKDVNEIELGILNKKNKDPKGSKNVNNGGRLRRSSQTIVKYESAPPPYV